MNELSGADVQDRTGDLVLTKDALCQLSYIGSVKFSVAFARRLERETGIEPATNSLEGCDSTTELLPRLSMSLRIPNTVSIAMVAREGLEPSKPLGRQIYSLLRLTASLPRQLSVMNAVSNVPRRSAADDGAGEGIRTPDLLITNQLLYRPELRQPDKRGTIALSVPEAQHPYGSTGWAGSSSGGPGPV